MRLGYMVVPMALQKNFSAAFTIWLEIRKKNALVQNSFCNFVRVLALTDMYIIHLAIVGDFPALNRVVMINRARSADFTKLV